VEVANLAVDPQQGHPLNTRRRSGAAIFWGFFLVAAGIVLLTQTLGLLPSPNADIIGVIFAVGGFAVLASYVAIRAHWWTLIVGMTLLGIGAAILLPGAWGGAIFLGGIGLAFVLVALTDAKRWWAIIPAGTLLTLALIALLGDAVSGTFSGALLFFGLAATFGVLAIVSVQTHKRTWPIYPAIGCLLFGLLVATTGGAGAVVWPLILVALGVFLLIRASTRRTT
jgi:hypothetical protein